MTVAETIRSAWRDRLLQPTAHVKTRRSFYLLTLIAVSLSPGGCLGGTTEVVPVAGTYELQTINGSRIPYTFTNGVTITKEVMTVRADGSFSDVATRADGSVVTNQGVYSNFGGTVNFVDQTSGLVYQGFVSGTTLTTQIGNFASVYAKTGPATN